jgi:uncharacterized membrane protein
MEVWDWIVSKFDVLFSGLGVYIISLVVGLLIFFFFRSKTSSNKVSMKNISAGRDVVGRDKRD